MTIDALQDKIIAAEAKVERCKKTIERHKFQMEKKAKQLREMGIDPEGANKYDFVRNGNEMNREAYWLLCDYDGKKDDIKGATQKLEDAERILLGWKVRLDEEINKEKVINDMVPQVIKDFLEDWKEKAFGWYCQRYEEFLNFREDLRLEEQAARLEAFQTLPEYADARDRHQRIYGDKEPDYSQLLNLFPWKPVEVFLKDRRLDHRSIHKRLSAFGDQLIFKMLDYRKEDERLAFLASSLEEDKKKKLLNMVYSITDITGPITDAKYLYVSAGDLNGVILGEKGAAKLQTFSAGGWNIQCFHYRTRVDNVTEKYKEDPDFLKHLKSGAVEKPALDDIIQSCEDVSKKRSPVEAGRDSVDKER